MRGLIKNETIIMHLGPKSLIPSASGSLGTVGPESNWAVVSRRGQGFGLLRSQFRSRHQQWRRWRREVNRRRKIN